MTVEKLIAVLRRAPKGAQVLMADGLPILSVTIERINTLVGSRLVGNKRVGGRYVKGRPRVIITDERWEAEKT
jgi:hypothetical protein